MLNKPYSGLKRSEKVREASLNRCFATQEAKYVEEENGSDGGVMKEEATQMVAVLPIPPTELYATKPPTTSTTPTPVFSAIKRKKL